MVYSIKLAEQYAALKAEAGADCVLLMQDESNLEGEPVVSRDGSREHGSAQPRPPGACVGCGSVQPRPPGMAANADNTESTN